MQGNPRYEKRASRPVPYQPGGKVGIEVDFTLNGERYTFKGDMPAGERSSGVIGINRAAAHLINAGEQIIIGFELSDMPIDPSAILVDEDNAFVRSLTESAGQIIEDFD